MNTSSVFATFTNRASLERALDALKTAGFASGDISSVLPETHVGSHAGEGSKRPERTATGGAAGLLLGGALGWLVGIGSLAIPGVGLFVAAGPLMAALAGAGVGAGVGGAFGGIAGAIKGLGLPEHRARQYEEVVHQGGMLVCVHCDEPERIKHARQILEDAGAQDLALNVDAAPKEAILWQRDASVAESEKDISRFHEEAFLSRAP